MYECGYPLNMMDTSAHDFLASLYRDIPESEMTTFYLECLENFAKDVRSGYISLCFVNYPIIPSAWAIPTGLVMRNWYKVGKLALELLQLIFMRISQ